MSLLLEIQEAAADGSVLLSTLLRKCRLLASRLDSEPLEEWLRHELDGYGPDVEVPAYRRIQLQFRGTFSGSWGSGINNAPIPQHLVEHFTDNPDISTFECRQGIATLEGAGPKSGTASINMDNLILLLNGKLYEGYSLVSFSAEFPRSALTGIENAVRNRVLEFAIRLWREEPKASEIRSSTTVPPIPAASVTQIFNTTVSGQANVVGTAHRSTLIASGSIGDLDALRSSLAESGLDADSLDKLEVALKEDPAPPDRAAGFGPKVRDWITGAMGKAASGAWGIGIGAAGKVVEESLLGYYGLK